MKFLSKIKEIFAEPISASPMVPVNPVAAPKPKRILEVYRDRQCPERERFNETLVSTGFVAKDGNLRIFYNDRKFAVEMEVNDTTFDLRELTPYPQHPKWIWANKLVHAWLREHGVPPNGDFHWVSDNWS
jgi:hypothetical protein